MVTNCKTLKEWEDFGLLAELPEDRKFAATHAFNVVFNWIEEHHEKPEQDIPGFTDQNEMLPLHVIHKMISDIDLTDQEILNICTEVYEAFNKFDITEILKHTYSTIGLECEFMHEFTEKIINKLENK